MNIEILPSFNQKIDFKGITADKIESSTKNCIEQVNKQLNTISAITPGEKDFQNTMESIDDIHQTLGNLLGIFYILGYTSPVEDVRNAALSQIAELEKFGNEIDMNEELYCAVKLYSEGEEASKLTGAKKKFLEEKLRHFKRNGFELRKEKREELKEMKDSLSELGLEFETNIAQYKNQLIVTEEEMKGLPEDYKESHKLSDGTFSVDLTYPSYRPFMKYSESESARKELFMKFMNRAANKNPQVLKQMLIFRNNMAHLLGYDTFAKYVIEEKMAKTPEAVWEFENELKEKLQVKVKADYNELLKIKQTQTGDETENEVFPWESSYYNNILLKENYDIDSEIIKEYFEVDNVINGLFSIAQKLYNVEFVEEDASNAWANGVKSYAVSDNGKTIGRFYLDLHPRDNKYGHAAMFPIIGGKQTEQGYQIPIAALVCNFPEATESRPALLPHGEVETFFHEFGHLMHGLLTKAELSTFSGTSVARDFVEVPSQMFENWVWNYDALQIFGKHYKTKETLPKALFDKMLAARNVGSGLQTIQQVFYGILDLTYHDLYNPFGQNSTTDVVRELQNELTPFNHVEGTCFEASFGHLEGYAAGYYGYLWAKVFSEDVFSVFEKEGVLNPEVGQKFKETILEKGSTKDEMELLVDFLGRKPSQDAFLKSVGIDVEM